MFFGFYSVLLRAQRIQTQSFWKTEYESENEVNGKNGVMMKVEHCQEMDLIEIHLS